MNKTVRLVSAACGAALLVGIAGCDRHEYLEAESRDLGDYSAIDLRGAAELKITVGQATSVKIEGSDYAVKALRTEVRDNTLYIQAKKTGWAWFGDGDELRLTITLPKLVSLRSSGAGSIDMAGLNGGDQTVHIAGTHNLEATGQLDKLTIELDGVGNIDYGKVTSQEARVTVNGAGHVLVRPSQLLSATMNGVGAIQYEGDPQKVESKIHGVGTIGPH